MNPLRPFLSLSFIVPKYEGPLPEFDPGDVVELELEEEEPVDEDCHTMMHLDAGLD